MRKCVFLLLLMALGYINTYAQNVPIDLMVGFATMNGGTRGGIGGDSVVVNNLKDFKKYAAIKDTAYIILVSGRISSGDDKGASVKVASNKSIIGIGADAFLDGIGLAINSKSNIIIRNIKFTLTSITNTLDTSVYDADGDEGRPQIIVNRGDCIRINSASSNIWIDHCEFFQVDPKTQTNQDLYDGLIDVSGPSKYITISWCYFHDHHKCTLVGSSDKDDSDRFITFHHNFYKNISQRTPSYRSGHGHVFNNYFLLLKSTGVTARVGACLRVESNVFENCKDPITSINGFCDSRDNVILNPIVSKPEAEKCIYEVPYNYSEVRQNSSDIKNTVQKYAGVGIIK